MLFTDFFQYDAENRVPLPNILKIHSLIVQWTCLCLIHSFNHLIISNPIYQSHGLPGLREQVGVVGCQLSSASRTQEYSGHVCAVLVRTPLKQTLGGGCTERDMLGEFLGSWDKRRKRSDSMRCQGLQMVILVPCPWES